MDATSPSSPQNVQPDVGIILSELASLLSLSVIALLFGIKTFKVHSLSLSYSRWLVLIIYVLSCLFAIFAVVLSTTSYGNYASCLLAEVSCDIFYGGTKITIYTWLIERVHIVTGGQKPRLKNNLYRFHLVLLAPYTIILYFMVAYHVSEITDAGVCMIGIRRAGTIPTIIYDFLLSSYLTAFFVAPLIKIGKTTQDWRGERLSNLTKRTLVASVVSLLVSFANILAVAIVDGEESSALCLACCDLDVTINVVTIHWVTTHSSDRLNGTTDYSRGGGNHTADRPGTNHRASTKEDLDNIHTRNFDNDNSTGYSNTNGQSHHYHANGRFVLDADRDDLSDFQASSIIESQCSRKSLTKLNSNLPWPEV